jgi:hypothetical protein
MVCITYIKTGDDTGLVVPYDTGDYHTWKGHEADLLLGDPARTLVGMEKCYHVKWTAKPQMAHMAIMASEEFEQKYASKFEKIEGPAPKFHVTRGGGFTIKVSGKTGAYGHLDRVARPLWVTGDKRTR